MTTCEKRSEKHCSSGFALDKDGQKRLKPNKGICRMGKPKMHLGTGCQASGLLPSLFFYRPKRLLHILEVYFPNMAAALLFNNINAVESYL